MKRQVKIELRKTSKRMIRLSEKEQAVVDQKNVATQEDDERRHREDVMHLSTEDSGASNG